MSFSRMMMSSKEEVDPRDLERRVESDVEEDSRDDEDEFEDDDEDDVELNIYGTWRTESDGFHVRWLRVRDLVHDRVCLPVHVCLPVRAGHPSDKDCLPVHAGRPCDRDRLPAEHARSATFPFFLTTRFYNKEQMRGSHPLAGWRMGRRSAHLSPALLRRRQGPPSRHQERNRSGSRDKLQIAMALPVAT
ncbi:hypothetical protein Taro_054243 [Colocasia esculenta]|uniref:Uncharacterized protein n=1 Tax=Colocasia esculenta TaxID=4460 RepID=A0A843XN04_COLES|nr:hypothetical protein [Colocasia esculenta]